VRRGTLRNGLHIAFRIDDRLAIAIEIARGFELIDRNMLSKTGDNSTWMQRESSNAVLSSAAIQLDGKEHVRRFRLAVCAPSVVVAPVKIQVFPNDPGETVPQ